MYACMYVYIHIYVYIVCVCLCVCLCVCSRARACVYQARCRQGCRKTAPTRLKNKMKSQYPSVYIYIYISDSTRGRGCQFFIFFAWELIGKVDVRHARG